MAQAPIGTGTLSDWLPVHFASMIWQSGQTLGLVNDILAIHLDQLEQFATGGSFNPSNQGVVSGGAIPKPTIVVGQGYPTGPSNFWSIPIPDFVINKQPDRLLDWSGLEGDDMGISGDDIAGRRVALQIEYVLSCRDLVNQVDTIGGDLAGVLLIAKYRGFGAIETNPDPGTLGDTEDTPITADTLNFFPNAIFDDMGFPTGSAGGGGDNLAVTFADDGIARLQWCIEVPSTVAVGDQIEITMFVDTTGQDPAVDLQYQHCIYRWIRDPFPFETNRGVQMLGQDADPNGDNGGDPDRALLEPQSRQDGDTDADPYAP